MTIPKIRGATPRIPTHSRVRRPSGLPLARLLHAAGFPRILQSSRLLQLDLRASLFELSLDLVGFVLVHAFLDRLWRAFDEILGFLEAQACDGADFLDDLDLLLASTGENDGELGLLFRRSGSSAATRRTGHRDSGGSGNAPLFFEQLCQFGSFEHRQARKVVYDFL